MNSMSDHLISATDMARFVTSGYLKYDNMVPKELCIECHKEIKETHARILEGSQKQIDSDSVGKSFEEIWPQDTAIGQAFRLPKVKGLIQSLVGENCLHDHHAIHVVKAHTPKGPNMHQDSVIDFRPNYFDIQLSFFPVDTTDEMGGTYLIPGTQFRNVRTGEISGYQHIRGKVWASCAAGAIYVWNTRIWHGARSNHSNADRFMYKLRLNPTIPQICNFNTSDIDDPQISEILQTRHGWEGNDMRYEIMKRVELWRYVSDQPNYDVSERFLRRREYVVG